MNQQVSLQDSLVARLHLNLVAVRQVSLVASRVVSPVADLVAVRLANRAVSHQVVPTAYHLVNQV